MTELYLYLGLFALTVVVGVVSFFSQGRQWKEAARRLGLEYDGIGFGTRPGIHGRFRGVWVKVTTVTRHRVDRMLYEVKPPTALPPGLYVRNQDALASLGKLLGGQDVQVGLARLDDTFVIRTSRPQATREFFRRPGLADALFALHKRHGSVFIEHGSVFVERPSFDSADDIEPLLNALVDTAEKMAPPKRALPSDTDELLDEQPSDRRQPAPLAEEGDGLW